MPEVLDTGNREYWRIDFDDPSVDRSRKGSIPVYQHGLNRISVLSGKSLCGTTILDVGSGMGVFLSAVKNTGAIPYGLELSPDALAYTRKNTGIESLILGEFETTEISDAPFDIITGWNVLEHVRHPKAWLEKAHALLKPDGVILIKVPNVTFSGLIARHAPLLRKLGLPTTSYLATRPPLHLYGFSARTLQGLLRRSGFEVLSVERSMVRETAGMRGRVVTALAAIAGVATLGRMNFHPLIMAVARKKS
ncbi:MAG: class I SAM-dependent methyltransferase [Verrucomicrobia bacterium]|nr:class I SAM-dependent methyltransferase [Verrucomicrobiota bacterium]